MFNLLPESMKEKAKRDYKFRRLLVTLSLVIFLQCSFLIFLFPSWIVSTYKEKEIVSQVANIGKSQSITESNSALSIIKSTNKKLDSLNIELEYPRVTPFINVVLSKKTGAIYITGFSFITTDKKTGTLELSGVSTTRESLVSFVKRLKESGVFKAVDLPISNLAKDKNINFSIGLILNT